LYISDIFADSENYETEYAFSKHDYEDIDAYWIVCGALGERTMKYRMCIMGDPTERAGSSCDCFVRTLHSSRIERIDE
jgi:hypothetical protein